jgi:hypothetical protein
VTWHGLFARDAFSWLFPSGEAFPSVFWLQTGISHCISCRACLHTSTCVKKFGLFQFLLSEEREIKVCSKCEAALLLQSSEREPLGFVQEPVVGTKLLESQVVLDDFDPTKAEEEDGKLKSETRKELSLELKQEIVAQQKAAFVAMVNSSYKDLFGQGEPVDPARLMKFEDRLARMTVEIKAVLEAVWFCLGDFMHHLSKVFNRASDDIMTVFGIPL